MKIVSTLLVVLSAQLAGCGGGLSGIREVSVPVVVPCVTNEPAKPAMPLQNAKPDEDIFTLVKKALAEIEIRKGYEGELEAALTACKK